MTPWLVTHGMDTAFGTINFITKSTLSVSVPSGSFHWHASDHNRDAVRIVSPTAGHRC